MTVTLAIPTVTYAIKARRALTRIGITSKLIKTVLDDGGCQYTIEISESDFYSALYELKSIGIPYKLVGL